MTLKIRNKKILCHLKSKIKKLFGRNCILDNFITRKFDYHRVFLWIKDPAPVFSRIRIRVTQKDRIRPDPDPQHCLEVQAPLYICTLLQDYTTAAAVLSDNI